MSIKLPHIGRILKGIGPATYIVYKDGERYYAVNGMTNAVEYSSENATNVIQYAINKASEMGGGVVRLRSGEYQLSKFVLMKSNVVLEGEGRTTRIITPTDAHALNFSVEGLENVVVRNLFIDGRGRHGALWIAPPGGEIRPGPKNVLIENVIAYGSGVEFLGGATVEIRGAKNVIIRNSEIAYGGHNGIYIDAPSRDPNYPSEEIHIINNYIHDNWDDAIDPNNAKRVFAIGNYIINNQYSCFSIEYNTEYAVFANNYVVGGQFITIIDSAYVAIIGNYLYISSLTERPWQNSKFITFIGNFFGPGARIVIRNSHSISIIGNHLLNNQFNQPIITVEDSHGFVIKNNYINSWNDETNRTEYIHPVYISGTSDDYEIVDNFIEAYTKARGKFVGSRYRVKGNIYNRRGVWFAPIFHDYDGTMTGTVDTVYTFEEQCGEVTVNTSTSGVITGNVSFPVRYPNGKVPVVMVTLKDLHQDVVVDSLTVTNVTETGFTYRLRVTSAVAGTSCKLVWCAKLP